MARECPTAGGRSVRLLDLHIRCSALPRIPKLAREPGCEPPDITQFMMTEVLEKTLPRRQMWQYHLVYGGKGFRSGLCPSLWQALGADPKESLRRRLAWSRSTGLVPDIL